MVIRKPRCCPHHFHHSWTCCELDEKREGLEMLPVNECFESKLRVATTSTGCQILQVSCKPKQHQPIHNVIVDNQPGFTKDSLLSSRANSKKNMAGLPHAIRQLKKVETVTF